MAAMVSSDSCKSSASLNVQVQGHRNKRKFPADPPLTDMNKLLLPQTQCSQYEFSSEKCVNDFNLEPHDSTCDLCSSISCSSTDKLDADDFPDLDWNDMTETQLEELVLINLDTTFRSAIKKICSNGYSDEAAMKAVLRPGICYGCQDTVSNIVDNALTFLGKDQEVDSSREHFFEDLRQLESYVMAEMVCVLREVRPFFSSGDAMWCLLICDMNVSHACAMYGESLTGVVGDESVSSLPSPQVEHERDHNSVSSTNVTESNPPFATSKPHPFAPYPLSVLEPELSPAIGIPKIPSGGFSSLTSIQAASNNACSGKERPLPPSGPPEAEAPSTGASASYPADEKITFGRKGHGEGSKREPILRQKLVHLEKSYRAYGSKGGPRAGKHSSLGSLLLDKKCKSLSDCGGLSLKSASIKISKTVGLNGNKGEANLRLSFGPDTSSDMTSSSKMVNNPPLIPSTIAELSSSLPSKTSSDSSFSSTSGPKPNNNIDIASCYAYIGMSSNKMDGEWSPRDKKDEIMLKLILRVRELQTQLHEWTEWAQQKVMQAAQRLSKDRAEIRSLRQEKEEVARLKKEKSTLEQNTIKKLSEMESALSKASGQVEWADATARRLEIENVELRQEMESAKLHATESAASCQEISSREVKSLKNIKSWERQKAVLLEELTNEKRKLTHLQKQLEQARVHRDHLEARWRQEEKLKEKACVQAQSEQKEREEIEASSKSEEDAIRSKAEVKLQKYRDYIQKLESQIAQLRLKTNSSRFTAFCWGKDDGRNTSQKNSYARYIAEIMNLQELGHKNVQRERECVMCLTEEMSVVFLPCAHQVVCTKCSELHEKQGMKDCPSCRAPILRRISVRSA